MEDQNLGKTYGEDSPSVFKTSKSINILMLLFAPPKHTKTNFCCPHLPGCRISNSLQYREKQEWNYKGMRSIWQGTNVFHPEKENNPRKGAKSAPHNAPPSLQILPNKLRQTRQPRWNVHCQFLSAINEHILTQGENAAFMSVVFMSLIDQWEDIEKIMKEESTLKGHRKLSVARVGRNGNRRVL